MVKSCLVVAQLNASLGQNQAVEALVVEFQQFIFDSIFQIYTYEIGNPKLIFNNQK